MTPEQFALFARIEQEHWWFVARRLILRRILRRVVPPGENKTIIDVGCGTGGTIASLAGEYRVCGIDTTPDAVALASGRFAGVPFVLGSFPNGLSGYLENAAALLCMDVIEHVDDDVGFVRTLVNAAPAGAHVLITVPADMSLWSQHDLTNDHKRRYDRPMLRRTWADLPVDVRLLSHFNTRLYPMVKAARWLANRNQQSHGADGTDFNLSSRPVNWALTKVFVGEGRRLEKSLDRPEKPPYWRGVSLMALLRKH